LRWVVRVLRLALKAQELSHCRPRFTLRVTEGFTVDETQMAAMQSLMGGDMGMAGGMPEDPFAMEDAPPGYSMVMVPDAVLPAVMELVSQAEQGGMGAGAAGMPPMM